MNWSKLGGEIQKMVDSILELFIVFKHTSHIQNVGEIDVH
jgi:hypothetical protein